MPSNAIVTLVAGQLPQGFCFQTPQQYYEAIIAATSAFLPGNFSTFNFGNTVPDPGDQDKPWLRLDVNGDIDRWYVFVGQWRAPNPIPPSSLERRIFRGSGVDIWSYDGGDGTDPGVNPPTDTTGAMWQRDLTFNERFPLGLSGSYPLDSTGGSFAETHHHTIPVNGLVTGGVTPIAVNPTTDDTTIDITNPYLAVSFISRTARKFYVV